MFSSFLLFPCDFNCYFLLPVTFSSASLSMPMFTTQASYLFPFSYFFSFIMSQTMPSTLFQAAVPVYNLLFVTTPTILSHSTGQEYKAFHLFNDLSIYYYIYIQIYLLIHSESMISDCITPLLVSVVVLCYQSSLLGHLHIAAPYVFLLRYLFTDQINHYNEKHGTQCTFHSKMP